MDCFVCSPNVQLPSVLSQHVPARTVLYNMALKLEISVFARAHAHLSNVPPKTHYNVPHGGNNQNGVIYIHRMLLFIIRVEWMKGICHLWSRGRLISPSLPVGDGWYLNLNSQKRPPGRNLGEHR